MEVEGFESPQKKMIPVHRSARTHRAPNRLCLNIEVEEHSLGDLNELTNYKAAMLDPESDKWLDAMNTKMQSIKDNQVWCLIDLPHKGFIDPNHPRKVCKLQRSIYGLKQASSSWNKRFDKEIKKFGFAQNLDEPCVYQKASGVKCLAIKVFGEATFILGIKIYQNESRRLIGHSRSAYMDKILKIFKMDNFKRWLGRVSTINKPIKMFCDNSAALLIANEPGVKRGARHYHRRYHYIRKCIVLGEINLLKVHTDDNLADPFTKALPKGKLTQHARSMGLRLASSFI
uniref:Reverse transcriptase Ty1/copia-type domain-containing protein n=1 Tax=Tanacetum cinerariifolium TaxID=118510 RepID=A0A6L2JBT0_TANCI|nr:hypothetical protein [Tanacetum cinerariifolium]